MNNLIEKNNKNKPQCNECGLNKLKTSFYDSELKRKYKKCKRCFTYFGDI
jgi:hypothetical protein